MSGRVLWLVTGRDDLRRFLETFLGSYGYNLRQFIDASEVLAALGRGELPDLLISDDPPPGLPRATIEARLREIAPFVRTVFLREADEALLPDESRRFATDDITLNAPELLELLERLVSEGAREQKPLPAVDVEADVKRSLLTTISTFVGLIERYEFINGGNGALVQKYAVEVARELGLSTSRVEAISCASLVYDIGMIRVRPEVKLKVTPLSPDDMAMIREHPRHGADFCASLRLPWDIHRYVLHHHERYDGRGYPDGVAGRKIPIGARILAVGDAYFAMIAKRPNREPVSEEEALGELQRQAGLQFDPEIVEIWSSLIQVRFLGETSAGEGERPKRIALIDDDRELRVLLDMKFSGLGYQVVTVVDAARVLPLLIDAAPEAILINADLPWVDAYQVLHRVRQEPSLGGVPFILLSADHKLPADRARAASAGADDYIVRPSPLQDLVSRVNGAIRKKRRLTGQHFVRPPSAAGIRGQLLEMGLAEICQVLAQGFKTARVDVIDSQAEGHLFFEQGKLKHATYDDLEGSAAFYAMLRIKEGEFAIEHGVEPPAETVQERLEFLLMEGMRLLDEERRQA
jgi:response regulator RpfG family c-di-GMP phosphodiesterase